MYLTRLDMDITNRKVCEYLQNPNRLHGALCRAVRNTREEARLQYRIINERARHSIYVYSAAPFGSSDIPQGLWLSGQRDISDWVLEQSPGTLLAFDLLAVPSKKVPQETSRNSRRVILKTVDERLKWVRRHCDSKDCRILELREYGEVHASVRKGHEQRSFMITGFKYAGCIKVNRPEALNDLITRGIGSEKVYGFGMFLVSHL